MITVPYHAEKNNISHHQTGTDVKFRFYAIANHFDNIRIVCHQQRRAKIHDVSHSEVL